MVQKVTLIANKILKHINVEKASIGTMKDNDNINAFREIIKSRAAAPELKLYLFLWIYVCSLLLYLIAAYHFFYWECKYKKAPQIHLQKVCDWRAGVTFNMQVLSHLCLLRVQTHKTELNKQITS